MRAGAAAMPKFKTLVYKESAASVAFRKLTVADSLLVVYVLVSNNHGRISLKRFLSFVEIGEFIWPHHSENSQLL
jgi:hypothetical protein